MLLFALGSADNIALMAIGKFVEILCVETKKGLGIISRRISQSKITVVSFIRSRKLLK